MTKVIKFISHNNPDWNGFYKKSEVEQSMLEVGVQIKEENDWLYWILNHVLDFSNVNGLIEEFICECNNMLSLELNLKDGKVTIIKIYGDKNDVVLC